LIPFSMGERVAGALPRAVLHRVHGGHHNDLFDLDRAGVLDAVVKLGRELPGRGPAAEAPPRP
jgi:hypothetical protein